MNVNSQEIKDIIINFTNLLADTERRKHSLTPQEIITMLKEGLSEGIEVLMSAWLVDDIAKMEDVYEGNVPEEVDYRANITGQYINKGFKRWVCGDLVLWAKDMRDVQGWIEEHRADHMGQLLSPSPFTRMEDTDIRVHTHAEEDQASTTTIDQFLATLL